MDARCGQIGVRPRDDRRLLPWLAVGLIRVDGRYYGGQKFVPLGFKKLVILQSVNKVKLNL